MRKKCERKLFCNWFRLSYVIKITRVRSVFKIILWFQYIMCTSSKIRNRIEFFFILCRCWKKYDHFYCISRLKDRGVLWYHGPDAGRPSPAIWIVWARQLKSIRCILLMFSTNTDNGIFPIWSTFNAMGQNQVHRVRKVMIWVIFIFLKQNTGNIIWQLSMVSYKT